MKVKHIIGDYIDDFEGEINRFIENKKVIDIKYSSNVESDPRYGETYFGALIMYEEEK